MPGLISEALQDTDSGIGALRDQRMSEPTALDPSKAAETPAVPECLQELLASRVFEKAPALRGLALYLWQYRDDPISEYAIATEALGRNALFDPKTDATVRVQISRLRQRLDKYYEDEGKNATDRVTIPLGSHCIQIETGTRPEEGRLAEKDVTSSAAPAEPAVPRRHSPALICACGVLAVLSLVLGIALYRARAGIQVSRSMELPQFWQSFFHNRRPTRIALPTPAFFGFEPGRGQGTILIRDTLVNDYQDLNKSVTVGGLMGKLGKPSLAQCYTVTSDTFAAVQLAQYLHSGGREIQVHSSADATPEALDEENVIAVGTSATLNVLKPYLDSMSLRMLPREMTVEVRSPGPGEPSRVDLWCKSSSRCVWPGVIAVLPGHSGRSKLLVLLARSTASLVSFLTTTEGLQQLDKLWRAKGSPEYFEVLIHAETDDEDRMISTSAGFLRPYVRPEKVTAP